MKKIIFPVLAFLLLVCTGCESGYDSYIMPDSINGRVKKITVVCHKKGDSDAVIFREISKFNQKRKLVSYRLKEKKFNRRVSYTPRKYYSKITYMKGETDRFTLHYNRAGSVVSVKDRSYLPDGGSELYQEKYRFDSDQRLMRQEHILNGSVITSFRFGYHPNGRIKKALATQKTKEKNYTASLELDSTGKTLKHEIDTASIPMESLIRSEDHWFSLGNALDCYYDVVRGKIPVNSVDSRESWLGVAMDISWGRVLNLKSLEQDERNNPTLVELDGVLYDIRYRYY